jgi:hypothetical protein
MAYHHHNIVHDRQGGFYHISDHRDSGYLMEYLGSVRPHTGPLPGSQYDGSYILHMLILPKKKGQVNRLAPALVRIF